MPSFIEALTALGGNTNMDYVNYIDMRENQKEFLLNTNWEFDWISKPAAVYYPGDAIFKQRMTTFTPSITKTIGQVNHIIRGFQINQATTVTTNGTISMSWVDREDQAITVMVDDWSQKCNDRDLKYSFRKEDTSADISYKILNTSRIPVRELKFLTCQPTEPEFAEEGVSEQEPASMAEVTLTLSFEHHKRVFLNL